MNITDIKKIVLSNPQMRSKLNSIVFDNVKCPYCGEDIEEVHGGYFCKKCKGIICNENYFDRNIETYATDEDYVETYNKIIDYNKMIAKKDPKVFINDKNNYFYKDFMKK